jgi:hypothetical protein
MILRPLMSMVARVNMINQAQIKLEELVEHWPWHGSFFPVEQCFNELKERAAVSEYKELRELIDERATRHDSSLE